MRKPLNKLVKLIILLSALPFLPVVAQGNLLITPTRVVFDGNKTREDLNITNIGNDTAVYIISFLHYQMLPSGGFQQIEDESLSTAWADKYLRIFPRRITLGPKESQIVRMQYRKMTDMGFGEYRSHLYFRAEKEAAPLGMQEKNLDSTQMAVKITPIFGISIPVILRVGDIDHQLSLSDIAFTSVNDSVAQLNVSICRSGEKSCYGDLTVQYTPENGESVDVGYARGVAVYTDLDKRNFSMVLHLTNGQTFNKGKIDIRYTDTNDRKVEYTNASYQLP